MKKLDRFYLLAFVFVLSGCVVRTYPLTKDRIDQDLTLGNRGYLRGKSLAEEKERKTKRTTQVIEIELHSPIKFERMPKPKPQGEIAAEKAPIEKREDQSLEGNRGYITQSSAPEIVEAETMPSFEKYTVQKGDTLQKISQKFYGTTKSWNKIYKANPDVLKGPNKIYPGQLINIPVEPLKEPKENLK